MDFKNQNKYQNNIDLLLELDLCFNRNMFENFYKKT